MSPAPPSLSLARSRAARTKAIESRLDYRQHYVQSEEDVFGWFFPYWKRTSRHCPTREEAHAKMTAGMKMLCFTVACTLATVAMGSRWASACPNLLLDGDASQEPSLRVVLSSLFLCALSTYVVLMTVAGGTVFCAENPGGEKLRRCVSLLGMPTFFTCQAIAFAFAALLWV